MLLAYNHYFKNTELNKEDLETKVGFIRRLATELIENDIWVRQKGKEAATNGIDGTMNNKKWQSIS